MDNYLYNQQTHVPTQREPDGTATHQNVGGGYGYQTDKWMYAKRFLVLGSEGGSYYTGERELTKANVSNIIECIKEDGLRTVDLIVEMRDRVPKRDTIMYALALAFSEGDKHTPEHDNKVKDKIHDIFSNVVRTGSDLLMFVAFIDKMRGWGKSLRRLIGNWYLNLYEQDRLTYQILKYQNRHGWDHKRVLYKCHLGIDNNKKFEGDINQGLFRWILGMDTEPYKVLRKSTGEYHSYEKSSPFPELIVGYENLKVASSKNDVLNLIEEHGFTHEMIPNQWKNEPEIWDKLLEKMPMTAMIRNLGKMSNVGLVKPFSEASKHIISQLNEEKIKFSRVHPIQMLMARLTYANQEGIRGKLTWEADRNIVDALESGFYHAFGNVEPINKNVLIAIDVSGSMSWGSGNVAGCPNLTPALAAACMAMVFCKTEPSYHFIGFEHRLVDLKISKNDSLDSVCRKVSRNGGGTDCALPMLYADKQDLNVEGFILFTDNVSWMGNIHPTRAFTNYQQARLGQAGGFKKDSPSHQAKLSASKAKLAVVSMTATDETIQDPDNPFMLDVVGFDTATPMLVNDFIRN